MSKLPAFFARNHLRNTAITACLAASVLAAPASAAECPGNPEALGTSRVLVVDPLEHPRIGTMQYPETLPLEDHEVVLTFDDGPLPKHSKAVLDILAAQCIKATFFTIGRMAQAYPSILREVHAAGHTIGTHTQNHLLRMNRMPIEQAEAEIDNGITSAAEALGDPVQVAPFLRIPGLLRSKAVEDYLVSKGIMLWSADFPADDWHRISPERVAQLALSRLEAKGRGVLLLHDIQARTVSALPVILRELKARGYRIVHVVPATVSRPKTPTQPWQWRIHPVDPALAGAKPGTLRFAFDPPLRPMSDFSSRNSMAIGAAKRPAHGHLASSWRAPSPLRLDAAAFLLGPQPAVFEFAKHKHPARGLGRKAIKTASGTP